jgi:magnesium transporter
MTDLLPETVLDVVEDVELTPDQIDDHIRELFDNEKLNVNQRMEALRSVLADEYSQDIADAIERLTDGDERYTVFSVLPPDTAAEVLDEISGYTSRQLLHRMPADRAASLLSRMPMDDLVELLADDIPDRQDEILAFMHPATAKEIRELQEYPADSAGRLMTRKYVKINQDMTAAEVLAFIRKTNDRYETVTDLYVLDPANRLIGVCSLRQVLVAKPGAQVLEFMETDITSVTPDIHAEEAARMLGRYDFLAVPVVTPDDRMLGIITVDDAIDVLTEAQTEDLLSIGGVSGDASSAPYFTVPILRVISQRFRWLAFLFLAGFITSAVLEGFQEELSTVVALTFYIPLLIGTGGNTGSQTVSMIIRGMTTNDIRQSDIFRVIRRELISGLILGTLLGAVALLRVLIDDRMSTALPLVVGLSVVAVCAWSNVIASVIPMLARRFKIDPALISAPLISTTVDATGLLIYMLVAKTLLTAI